jgi:transketolase
MASIVSLLPRLDAGDGPNVKLVAAISYELFKMQPKEYRNTVLHKTEWIDSTVVSNGARIGMHYWLSSKVAEEYAMTSDWDDRWRTGGSLDEVIAEAHLDPDSLWEGICRFARDREVRLGRLAHP